LSRSVFALSITELGKTASYANTEGSALPIANILHIAYKDGVKTTQWTRTPYKNDTKSACCLGSDGSVGYNTGSTQHGSRPCFTLPSNALFDPKTLEFMGVK
jgi:hypothetical protein